MSRLSVALLLTTSLGLGPAAFADSEDADFASALTSAAASGAKRGDLQAAGTLRLLAELPPPWSASVLATVESSDLLANWSTSASPSLQSLAGPLATLQGSATRASARPVPGGPYPLAFLDGSAHWLRASGPPSDRRELLLTTSDCLPDIAAFRSGDPLPAPPITGLVRLSDTLTSIPVDGSTDIRIRQGECEDASAVSVQVVAGPARTSLPITYNSTPDRFPRIDVDQLYVLSLLHRTAGTFALATELGYVYELYGAPITPGVDPALLKVDSQSVAPYVDANDDDGSLLSAHLSDVVGTGSIERFVVTRRIDAGGDVALLAQRVAVPEVRFESKTPVKLGKDALAWLRMHVPKGRWKVTTTNLPRHLDPSLTVYDGTTGRKLDENDDFIDGSRAAQVNVVLPSDRYIYIRLEALDLESQVSGSECVIEIRPTVSKTPSATAGGSPSLAYAETLPSSTSGQG